MAHLNNTIIVSATAQNLNSHLPFTQPVIIIDITGV